jgi:hypothetical protein
MVPPEEDRPDEDQTFEREESGLRRDIDDAAEIAAMAEPLDEEEREKRRNVRLQTRTRFESPPPFFSKEALRNSWDIIRQRLRNPSHPSTTSQSALEGGTDTGFGDGSSSFRRPGGGSQPRSASGYEATDEDGTDRTPPEPVHHVVVDSDLGQYIPPARSDNGSAATPGNGTGLPTTTDGSHAGVSGSRGAGDGTTGDASSIRRDRRKSWITRTWAWEMCVERCWPAFRYFCDSRFPEAAKEKSYQKEVRRSRFRR